MAWFIHPLTMTVRHEPFDWLRTGLSKDKHVQLGPFMVRQAHHERNVQELMGHSTSRDCADRMVVFLNIAI